MAERHANFFFGQTMNLNRPVPAYELAAQLAPSTSTDASNTNTAKKFGTVEDLQLALESA